MQPDTELETWRRQWQAHHHVPADLQRRVEREIRHAKRGLRAAIAVTVFFGVGVPLRAFLTRQPDDIVFAIGVWVFIALTWVVSLRITRGASQPAAATTAAFLEFSILSCRRHLAGISAGAVLYVIFLAFIVGLNYLEASRETPIGVWAYLARPSNLVVWGVTAAIGAVAAWKWALLRRELQNLESILKSAGLKSTSRV